MQSQIAIIGERISARLLESHMAISQHSLKSEYHCPECSGSLSARYESLACDDCGYTPRHGAD